MSGAPASIRSLTWLLLALLAGHDASHALDAGLRTSGVALAAVSVPQWAVLAALAWGIARLDRPRATALAGLLGTAAAAGFAAVHLVPGAPASFFSLEPSAASWALLWAPLAVGLALATAAWRERRGSAAAAPDPA